VGSKVKALKTRGGRRTPVRHAIPLGIVIFLVYYTLYNDISTLKVEIDLKL